MIRRLSKIHAFILLDELFGTRKQKLLNIICIALSFILSLSIFFTMIAGAEEETIYKEVVVKPGDTLWKISKDNMESHEDIRYYIYKIRQVNNLQTAQITPGQVIKLPK